MKTDFKIINEEDIPWQLHNKIHKALNRAYSHRSLSFHKKTYGLIEPVKRVIMEVDDEVVGHTAIFDTSVLVDNQDIKIAGIGMTLSLKPFCKLGFKMREQAIIECAELGYPLALGRVKNSERNKASLSPLVIDFLPIPMIGKSMTSHDWEIIAAYNTHVDAKKSRALISHFRNNKKIVLTTELF